MSEHRTPLFAAMQDYVTQNKFRFHTPGHQGVESALGVLTPMLAYDLTELAGLDSLYDARGAIAQSEAHYTKFYQSAGTFFSTGGSTLCVQTMLALVAESGRKILVGRNAHVSFVNAIALLSMAPVWLWQEREPQTGLLLPVTASQVENALQKDPEIVAVFVTSPDYFGVNTAIRAVAAVCKKHGVPLLVDAAHGAHYILLGNGSDACAQGADLACHSLHKTLPALTGAALLHVNNTQFLRQVKAKMSLFGSTSPSYLTLLSIDLLLPLLEESGKEKMKTVVEQTEVLKSLAREKGFSLPAGETDPTRLTLGFGAIGYSKSDFLEELKEFRVQEEYADDYYAVFILTISTPTAAFEQLKKLIMQAEPRAKRALPETMPSEPPQAITLREAVFAPHETIDVQKSVGRICASVVSACPPGIPLLVPGERIGQEAVEFLKRTGFFTVHVVK